MSFAAPTLSEIYAPGANRTAEAAGPIPQAAATQTWNPGGAGGGSGDWGGNNWGSASPWVSGNIALFGGTTGTVTAETQSVGGITFNTGGYTLSGGTLTLTPPSATTGFVVTTSGGTETITSALAGSTGTLFTKTGSGTLVANSGITGGTAAAPTLGTITGGTFSSATGAFDSVLQVGAGNFFGTAPTSTTTPQITLSAGTLRFSQNGGNLLAAGRALQVNAAGGAIVDGGTVGSSTNAQINGPLTFNAGTASTNLYLSNASGATTTFTNTGILSGTGNVVWNGAGTAVFQAVNTYSGSTTVNKGTLQLSNGSLGSNALTLAAGTTLALNTAKLRFDLTNSADRLAIKTGTVTTTGSNLVRLATGSTLATGTYPLISVASGSGSLAGTFQFDGANSLSVPAFRQTKQVGSNYYLLTLQNSSTAEQAVVTAAPANVINEMPMGSSITQGISGEGATYAGGGYRSQLYQSLVNDGRFTPHFVGSSTLLEDHTPSVLYNVLLGANELHHEGHSGYTTTGIIENLNANNGQDGNNGGLWLAPGNGVNPDYVTLSIGGNDYGFFPSETTQPLLRTDAIVSSIASLRPSAHIIWANLFYRPQTAGSTTVGNLQNTYYNPGVPVGVYNHVLAGQHVSFADNYTAVTPGNDASDISSDMIHPITAGYQKMATSWYHVLAFGSAFWTGAQDKQWSTVNGTATNFAQNYQRTTPRTTALDANTDVYFNGNTAALATTLGANLSVRSVNFAAGATGAVIVGGANTLTLGTGGITVQKGTGTHTLSANVALNGNQTWGNVSSNNFTVSGNISGSGTLTTTSTYTVQTQNSASSDATTTQTYTGTGKIIKTGTDTHSGGTMVQSGQLVVKNTEGSGTGSGGVQVSRGASFVDEGNISGDVGVDGTAGGTGVYGGAVTVNRGGVFNGAATIKGPLTVNGGGLVELAGGTLRAEGGVVNNGTVRLTSGAALAVGDGATFTNNGVLDVLTGGLSAPAGFIDHGVMIDSGAVRTRSVDRRGGVLTLTVDSLTGHTYQLQRSDSLDGNSFTNVGAPQSGTTGVVLTFQDADSTATQGFYRVQVDP